MHGDLHWANLFTPCALIDWEMWGTGPAGTDVAAIYCYSLLVPEVAARVRAEFADVLDTSTGRTAQLYVAARLLTRAPHDFPELTEPLRRHIEQVRDTRFRPASRNIRGAS